MMFRTHLMFSVLSGLIILSVFDFGWLFFAVFMFSSMIPDIDMPKSKIGRRHKLVSKILYFFLGHRGFMHTVYPAIALFILLYALGFGLYAFAALTGYISHLILDMMTPSGVRIFHPFLGFHSRGFIRTSGFLEHVLQLVFLVLLVLQIKWMWF